MKELSVKRIGKRIKMIRVALLGDNLDGIKKAISLIKKSEIEFKNKPKTPNELVSIEEGENSCELTSTLTLFTLLSELNICPEYSSYLDKFSIHWFIHASENLVKASLETYLKGSR